MSNILVSVILPTRKRSKLVERSVRSLLETADNPAQVEILIAYDSDDQESKQYFNSQKWNDLIGNFGASSQVIESHPWGYSELHQYCNALAKVSKGQWLMLWNDDAVMRTEKWDNYITENQGYLGMLHMSTENFREALTLFPVVPRKWIDIFGTYSQTNLCDSWIQDVCEQADAVRAIPVKVFHDRFDVTGNNGDETYQNRYYKKKRHNSDEMKQTRTAWAHRLMQFK